MPGAKGESGRAVTSSPLFKPTPGQRDLVMQLSAFGLRQSDICHFIKNNRGKAISEPTLRKHFAGELATGRLQANVRVAQTLYKKAIGGNTTAMIFWLKAQAGWRDAKQLELTGKDGGAVAIKEEGMGTLYAQLATLAMGSTSNPSRLRSSTVVTAVQEEQYGLKALKSIGTSGF